MWTRAELKAKGKKAFKANYWKSVFMAIILALILGGGTVAGGRSALNITNNPSEDTSSDTVYVDGDTIDINGYTVSVDGDIVTVDGMRLEGDGDQLLLDGKPITVSEDGEGFTWNDTTYVMDTDEVTINDTPVDMNEVRFIAPLIALVVSGVFLAVLGIGLAIDAFLLNPLEVGCRRFFALNLNQQASVNNIGYVFDHGYIQAVKTLFIRDIKLIGWGLLFIIPGIVKSYEYQMIPYLLAENPAMDTKEAFATSREMMNGNKWKSFVLDLSFIGWELLSVITLGLVGVFYANPYMQQTHAALYETLRYGNGTPNFDALPGSEQPSSTYNMQ